MLESKNLRMSGPFFKISLEKLHLNRKNYRRFYTIQKISNFYWQSFIPITAIFRLYLHFKIEKKYQFFKKIQTILNNFQIILTKFPPFVKKSRLPSQQNHHFFQSFHDW